MQSRKRLSVLLFAALAVVGCQEADTGPLTEPEVQATRQVPSRPASRILATVNLPPHPESAVHDAETDAYLVSNLGMNTGGGPFSHLFDEDDNGFISRVEVARNGRVTSVTPHWIGHPSLSPTPTFTADVDGITGVTIRPGTRWLYAVDRDEIFVFHLDNPSINMTIPLPGAGVAVAGALDLPNDIIVRADGTAYLTDTALDENAGRTLNDGVYRWNPGTTSWTKLVGGTAGSSDFGCPNGIDTDGNDGILFLTFCSNKVMHLNTGLTTYAEVEGPDTGVGRLDGLVRRHNGSLVMSDWRIPQSGSGVLRWVNPNANITKVTLENLSLPADIGFDAKRHRVLIPSDGDQALKIVHSAP